MKIMSDQIQIVERDASLLLNDGFNYTLRHRNKNFVISWRYTKMTNRFNTGSECLLVCQQDFLKFYRSHPIFNYVISFMSISQTYGYMVNFQSVCGITFATNVHAPTTYVKATICEGHKVAFERLRTHFGVTKRANPYRSNDYANRGRTSEDQPRIKRDMFP